MIKFAILFFALVNVILLIAVNPFFTCLGVLDRWQKLAETAVPVIDPRRTLWCTCKDIRRLFERMHASGGRQNYLIDWAFKRCEESKR